MLTCHAGVTLLADFAKRTISRSFHLELSAPFDRAQKTTIDINFQASVWRFWPTNRIIFICIFSVMLLISSARSVPLARTAILTEDSGWQFVRWHHPYLYYTATCHGCRNRVEIRPPTIAWHKSKIVVRNFGRRPSIFQIVWYAV